MGGSIFSLKIETWLLRHTLAPNRGQSGFLAYGNASHPCPAWLFAGNSTAAAVPWWATLSRRSERRWSVSVQRLDVTNRKLGRYRRGRVFSANLFAPIAIRACREGGAWAAATGRASATGAELMLAALAPATAGLDHSGGKSFGGYRRGVGPRFRGIAAQSVDNLC